MTTVALLLWPVVILVLFKRTTPAVATAIAIIGGYLLLPVSSGWDLPVLPSMNKDTITALVALIGAMIAMSSLRKLPVAQPTIMPGWVPKSKVGLAMVAALVIGSLLTAITNTDPLVFDEWTVPGLTLYHGLSQVQGALLSFIPLILARKFFSYPETQKTLLASLVVAALLYSLPTLFEARFSPQLNRMVYGFFPHDWLQHIRGGGFRPVVFLHHGLWLGIFFSMCTIASAALIKADPSRRTKYIWATLWLVGTLTISRNLGALAIACFLIPFIIFMSVRIQLLAALIISVLIISYPVLRGAGFVPTDAIVSTIAEFRPSRAGSLEFRFDNEDILLEKANERPLFGWGDFARNRVYNERGVDLSITDGGWVIAIGSGGWLRYFGQMGLMGLPIIFLALNRRRYNIDAATAGLCLVLSASMIDLIPNSTLTPITWLVAGALYGRLELGRVSETQLKDSAPTQEARSPYTRQVELITRK